MKITTDRSGDVTHMTVEWVPMSTERFKAIVKLVETAIGGAVLLGLTHMVGVWAIGVAVAAYVLTGVYRLMRDGF